MGNNKTSRGGRLFNVTTRIETDPLYLSWCCSSALIRSCEFKSLWFGSFSIFYLDFALPTTGLHRAAAIYAAWIRLREQSMRYILDHAKHHFSGDRAPSCLLRLLDSYISQGHTRHGGWLARPPLISLTNQGHWRHPRWTLW